MPRERRVLVEDSFRDLPRLEHDRLVARDAPELQIAEPRLTLAEHLAGTSDLEIALGEQEPVRRRRDGLHARVGLRRRRIGEQEAPRLTAPAADAAAQLVQL